VGPECAFSPWFQKHKQDLKLLYILSEYLPDSGGGIISHYARILPGLVARGHEVTVVLACKQKLDHPAYEVDGVRVRPLQSKFLEQYSNRFGRWVGLDLFYYLLPVAWAAWAQAQEECDYVLIEVTDWALLFLPWVVSEKRAPVVVSLHGSCGQVDWFGKGDTRSMDGDLVRVVEASGLRGADVVHANSRANAKFWREKTGREIRVIPPAYGGGTKADLTTIEHGGRCEKEQPKVGPKGERVGTSESKHTEDTGSAVGPCLDKPSGAVFSNPFTSELARASENTSPTRSAIGPANSEDLKLNSYKLKTPPPEVGAALDPRPSTLDAPGLVVGRLQNWKGAEVLCKALRLAPEIEIEWAGGDTDWGSSGKEASEYLAANYPDVFGKKLRWLGRLDRAEVAKKMQAAAFLVIPSLWDVFNLTVAEGMEAGLPVICSKAAGAEMLIEDGVSGFLFDPAKPEELAYSLKLVAGMLEAGRLKMGRNSQDAVKTHLNEERILNLLEESYGDAIKRGVATNKEAWLESLLSLRPGQVAQIKLNLAQRAIRKAGRILANV